MPALDPDVAFFVVFYLAFAMADGYGRTTTPGREEVKLTTMRALATAALVLVLPLAQAQAVLEERLIVRKDAEGNVIDPNVAEQMLRESLSAPAPQRLVIQLRTGPDYDPQAMGEDDALAARLGEQHRQSFARLRHQLIDLGLDRSVTIVAELYPLPLAVVETDTRGLEALISEPEVQVIYEDVTFRPFLHETLPIIEASSVHSAGATGTGQAVAVLDTGVQRTHPMFSGKIVGEACYATSNPGYAGCPLGTHGVQRRAVQAKPVRDRLTATTAPTSPPLQSAASRQQR